MRQITAATIVSKPRIGEEKEDENGAKKRASSPNMHERVISGTAHKEQICTKNGRKNQQKPLNMSLKKSQKQKGKNARTEMLACQRKATGVSTNSIA